MHLKKFKMAAIFKMAVCKNFNRYNKIIEPSNLVYGCIYYHSGVFYPTGIREGIYCDLLAITTLNLVIISPNTKVRGYIVFAAFLIIIIKSPTTKCRETYCFCPVSYYYVAPMKSGSDILLFFCFFVIMSPR